MRELSVQAANGTETDDDREAVQDEISQLQDELTRISDTTEFNTMKLLDGSQAGTSTASSGSGPLYGVVDSALAGAIVTSDVVGVKVNVGAAATTKAGQETAIWSDDGKTLSLNLAQNTTYSQDQIDELIANAKQEDSTASGVPANITVALNNGVLSVGTSNMTGNATVAGAKATSTGGSITSGFVGINSISFTANKYGTELNNATFDFAFDKKDGEESVATDSAVAYNSSNIVSTTGKYTIHLAAGKEYTAEDLEDILAESGFDFDVKLSGAGPDEPNTLFAQTAATTVTQIKMAGGTGVGDADAVWGQDGYDSTSGNAGITLQIGANEGQTMSFTIENMSARSLGVDGNKVDLSTQDGAQKATTTIDAAIKMVSKARGRMGAIQNRLEHTIANLDTAAENTQTAESRIRDVDMAEEMVEYSKNNILAQAGQSMLAQANQSTQGVLSLLQ
jgi:flagellin